MTPISLDFYGIEELLTDEERAARDRARRFVQEEVLSEIVPCHRAAKFPDNLIPRMGALGFYAPYLKEHGCAGLVRPRTVSSCKSSNGRIRVCGHWLQCRVRSRYRRSIHLAHGSNKHAGYRDCFQASS